MRISKSIRIGAGLLVEEISQTISGSRAAELVRSGFRVCLLGAPNSGKSTLMNALARRDVAIVSDEAGTTRDLIEVRLDIGGYLVVITDTAGIRHTDNKVEKEGIRRALEIAKKSDLVLFLVPPGDTSVPPEDVNAIRISSKADVGLVSECALAISALTGAGMDQLESFILERAKEATGTSGEGAGVMRLRHVAELGKCRIALESIASGEVRDSELVGEEFRQALNAIGRITGKVDVEDLLDVIFRDFCIGK